MKLFKLAKKLFLGVILLGLVVGGVVFWSIKTGPESLINKSGGYLLARSPFLKDLFIFFPPIRNMLGFDWAGDARFDYLTGTYYNQILIEVDREEGFEQAEEAAAGIREMLVGFCRKSGGVKIIYSDVIPSDEIPDNLQQLAEQIPAAYRDYYSQKRTAVIYLLLVNRIDDQEMPIVGMAFAKDMIVLHGERLRVISGSDVVIRQLFEQATAHETGHLFGLDHFEESEEFCLMNPRVNYFTGSNFDGWFQRALGGLGLEERVDYLEKVLPTQLNCSGELAALERLRGIRFIFWRSSKE